MVVCSHLLGEVERICDTLIAIDAGRLLRADRVDAMTTGQEILAVEVDDGTDLLVDELARRGITVGREGRLLLVPIVSDGTYDAIMRAVADLELPLHRLDQRRHHVAELFTPVAAASTPTGTLPEEVSHV